MTVNSSDIVSGPYIGNNVATQFSYDFRVDEKTQLTVFETDDAATPVVTTLTVDVDYTVNNVGTDGGGTIDRIAGALPTDYVWYIRANYEDTQDTAFASQGGFLPQVHEAALDRRTFISQQQQDLIDRSIRFPDSYSGVADLELPNPEADKTILWNATGDGLVNGPTVGTFAGYASAASASAAAALVSENAAAADLVDTNQDTIDTAADLVATNQDTIDTAADLVATNQDSIDTAADLVATNQDAIDTAADRVQTGLDAVDTANDVLAAAALLDSFDDAYLGSKASDPTLDNDGDPLADGALYFNTGSNLLFVYDLGTTTWIAFPSTTLAGLTDVTITSIASGEILKWNGSDWINNTLAEAGISATGHTHTLDAGSNVTITSNSAGEVLKWNGSAWINNTLAEAGIQAADADTAKLDVDQVWTGQQAGSVTTLTDATTIAVDLSLGNFYTVTLGANRTLGNPSNEAAGQSGSIFINQDGTGSRTLAYNGQWEFVGGTAPTLTTTASATDRLDYVVQATGAIHASIALDVK